MTTSDGLRRRAVGGCCMSRALPAVGPSGTCLTQPSRGSSRNAHLGPIVYKIQVQQATVYDVAQVAPACAWCLRRVSREVAHVDCCPRMSIFVIFSSFSSDFHEKCPFGIPPTDPQTSLWSVYLRVSLSNVQDKMGPGVHPNVSILATFEVPGPCVGLYAN